LISDASLNALEKGTLKRDENVSQAAGALVPLIAPVNMDLPALKEKEE